MSYTKADTWVLQQIAATGLPLVGGVLYAYVWDTSTPLAMYTNSAGSGSATSFTLNSLGMPQSAGGTAVDIYLDDAYVYKFILRDSDGVAVGPTIGPVYPSGGNGLTGTMTSMEALRASSVSFDYIETVAFYDDGTTGAAKLYRDGTGTPTGSGSDVIAAALAAGTFCNAAGVCYKLTWPQVLYFESFGAIADGNGNGGGTDNALFLQAAADFCEGKSIHGSGTYLTSKQIDFGSIHIICDGQIFIDGSDISTAPDAPDNAVVRFAGDGLTALPDLSGNVSAGTSNIGFSSAHGMSVGDYFCIYNPTDGSFNSRRTYYRAGEWCRVARVVSSTEVAIAGVLYADYAAADVDNYILSAAQVKITGKLRVVAPDITPVMTAVEARYCADSDFSGLTAIADAGLAGLSIWQCVNVTGRDITALQHENSGAGTDYGVILSNCQWVRLDGYFAARRHGSAMGGGDSIGAVPNRECHISGTVASYASAANGDMAADFHGNCEHCSYDATILGGLLLSGDYNRVRGKIHATTDGQVVYAGELLGFNHDLRGVEFISRVAKPSSSVGCFDVGGNSSPLQAATTRGGTLDLQDTRWIVPLITGQVVWIRNRGATGTDLRVNMNSAKFIETEAAGVTGLVRIDVVSGDAIDRASFDGVDIDRDQPFVMTGVTRVVNWRDSGTATVAGDTGVNTVSVAVTFNRRFPSAPKVATGMTVITSGGAGDRCMARVTSVTTTGFTMQVYTADEANFTGTSNITIDWIAG